MAEITVTEPTFMVQVGANGQITVFSVAGTIDASILSQLFTAQRDIAGATKLLEALIIKNLS